jgi:hypothetical protein
MVQILSFQRLPQQEEGADQREPGLECPGVLEGDRTNLPVMVEPVERGLQTKAMQAGSEGMAFLHTQVVAAEAALERLEEPPQPQPEPQEEMA